MVSHSQRVKIVKEDPESRREERMKPKGRVNYELEKLAEICENPENPKLFSRSIVEERTKVDASPSGIKELNQN